MSEQQQQKSSINFSNFAELCKHKDSLSEAARHTVEVLLKYAGTSDINEANQILSSRDELSLEDCEISDLTPLQSLTNLTSLNLGYNQISDITPLQSLINLTSLNLQNAQISDITALQSLTNLTELYLYDNQISDITALQSLTNLTSLHLGYDRISDITALQSLTNLTSLELDNNQISDLTALQSLINLTSLNLRDNKISDIRPLQSLTNLTELNLENNQISNITPLQSLTNLTYLSLYDNKISDITPLQSLTNLTNLYLRDNQISDITTLQSLTNLIYLNLDFDLSVNVTPQQKALIETCRHSWGTLTNSTEPVDRDKASTALKVFCEILGLEIPEIIFFSSPEEVLAQCLQIHNQPQDSNPRDRDSHPIYQLNKQVADLLSPFVLITELYREFVRYVEWQEQLNNLLVTRFTDLLGYSDNLFLIVSPKYFVQYIAMAEFCVSGLGMVLKPESQKLFEALKYIVAECGWIVMLVNVCYVCDRPIKLSLDSEYRLHAEGESAIEFADGYKIYSHHGVTLPEKYGVIHPTNWRSQWLLEEENAELRRVLIQEIGYARICQELQATELDSWQEYTLLRIDADIDGFQGANLQEPIHLLKMTCPSTGFIHALRVPPDITSAREAIRWVNWDIEPEEFSVQT
jgi:internalin A